MLSLRRSSIGSLTALQHRIQELVERASVSLSRDQAEVAVFQALHGALFGAPVRSPVTSACFHLEHVALQESAYALGYPDALAAACEQYIDTQHRQDRMWHGAYYTPQPLAHAAVACADDLLKSAGWLGLRDPSISVIDPAAGAGHLVTHAMQAYGAASQIHAWEILSLPAHVCSLRMRSALPRTSTEDAPRCTHADALLALPEWLPPGPVAALCAPPFNQYHPHAISPHTSAAEVFRRYAQANALLDAYACDDAFIKFLALIHDLLLRAGKGVASLIVRNNWLTSRAHAPMREALMRDFDRILVLDLHGDPHDRFHAPRHPGDESVYRDMVYEVGVCILLLERSSGRGTHTVQRADLFGSRASKWETLLAASSPTAFSWRSLQPQAPWYPFKSA